jgi:hypothetical protein
MTTLPSWKTDAVAGLDASAAATRKAAAARRNFSFCDLPEAPKVLIFVRADEASRAAILLIGLAPLFRRTRPVSRAARECSTPN